VRLVGTGVWGDDGVEEVFLEAGDVCGGDGFAAGGRGDNGQELELGEGGAGNVDALGVGAGVGWGEEEAGVVDEVVEEGGVGGRETFEEIAGAESEAKPEAFGARAGEEGAAGESLRVDGV